MTAIHAPTIAATRSERQAKRKPRAQGRKPRGRTAVCRSVMPYNRYRPFPITLSARMGSGGPDQAALLLPSFDTTAEIPLLFNARLNATLTAQPLDNVRLGAHCRGHTSEGTSSSLARA